MLTTHNVYAVGSKGSQRVAERYETEQMLPSFRWVVSQWFCRELKLAEVKMH